MATTTQVFEGVFQADADHSSLEAGTRHMGVGSFRTRFEAVSARLVSDGTSLRLEGEVRVDSIAIRNPPEFREHVVNGQDFFDAPNHPTIGFVSDHLRLDDDGTLTLDGDLMIKGRTHRISATGTYRPPTPDPYGAVRAALDLSTTVDRRDFGIDWQSELPNGGDALGWEVSIDVHLELVQPVPPSIGREELEQKLANGEPLTLVETLRTEHFKQGHLPGAIHIHFEDVEKRAPALLPDKDALIITYCSNTACRNSSIAKAKLEKLGYTNVRKYAEGKQDWQEAGLPLES